jgi:hypothetical protein
VAGLLDLSVRKVARIERRGVRRLQQLERRTGCSGSAAPRVIAILASTPLATAGSPSFPTATVSTARAPARADAREATAAPATAGPAPSSDDSGGVLGESADRSPPAAVAPIARPGDEDFTFVVMVLALLVAVGSGVAAVRREVR